MVTLNSSEMFIIIIFTAAFVIYTFTSISILNEENEKLKKKIYGDDYNIEGLEEKIIELKRRLDRKEQEECLRNLEEGMLTFEKRRKAFLELKNKEEVK